MVISKSIFKDYDIRGVYPKDLDDLSCYHIGKAVGTFFRKAGGTKIVVGMDNRESSPAVFKSFVTGALETGINVINIGLTITPVIHYAVSSKDFDAGVNVTASHNPPDHNGMKIDYRNGLCFFGKDIKDLYDVIRDEDYASGSGTYSEIDLNADYINFLLSQFRLSKIKVVVNCGHGMAGYIVPNLLKKLGVEVTYMGESPDSTFPKGTPNPENREFMRELSQKVLAEKADIGIGFDTDVDRMGAVCEDGKAISADYLLMLFAKYFSKSNPGKNVYYDVKCSSLVEGYVKKFGGIPVIGKTGHPYLAENVIKNKPAIGGEFSGHFYFGDRYFGFDDGVYTMLRLFEILETEKKPLSELIKEFPVRYSTSEVKVHCPDEKKFEVISDIKTAVKKFEGEENVCEIDGVRVKVSETGWFLIRASNTSSYLSIRAEGKDKDEVISLLTRVESTLSPYSFLDLKDLRNQKDA